MKMPGVDAPVDRPWEVSPPINDASGEPPDEPNDVPVVPFDASDAPGVDPSDFCAMGAAVPGAQVPAGFCVRFFADVREARTLVLAPNGDLFVGAPALTTPGGASGGAGAVIVLADDNHDGKPEHHTFLDKVDDLHGLALGGGYLYFTTQMAIWRTPYVTGQRRETGPRESLGVPETFGEGGRWTHGLARSVAGQLLASRGEYAMCGDTPGGEISRVEGTGQLTHLATELRNPMYLRCHSRDEVCAASELGEDQTTGAIEKFIVIRPGTAYGYPCCFTRDAPMQGVTDGRCGAVTREEASFPLSDTPFGFDWERGQWPTPYQGGVFVALHGSAYSFPSYQGARIVFARVDPTTQAPIEGWRDFVTGFGSASPTTFRRPSDVVFSPDGRMYFSEDETGQIYWVARTSPARP